MNTNRVYNFFRPNYIEEKGNISPIDFSLQGKCFDFISTFEDNNIPPDPVHGQLKYMAALVIDALVYF